MKKTNTPLEETTELKDANGNTISINPEPENDSLKDDNLVDKKTLKKYRIHWYHRIPYPVRALLIKYWFFGLNYFLFQMGLGSLDFFRGDATNTFAVSTLMLIFVSGFALGVFNDIFVYNILDVIEDEPGSKQPFVIFKSKKVYSLFINVIFGLIVGFLGTYLCGVLSQLVDPNLESFWFREPLSAALVMFIVDGAFVGLKDLIVMIIRHFRGNHTVYDD